ncbi:MAG: tetratricopeptide repeat protein [Novosphingobium sp.]|nr:tetratricopeptide repeat protein [Novosphingobium sp.]MCP5404399.1 tetratricopeptide repeat protein [Novosphingobium sp.]
MNEPNAHSPGEKIDELSALYRQGKFSLVAGKASELIRQFPQSAALWNMLGAAHKGLRQPDEAERCFRKACEMDPGNPGHLNNLAALFQSQGRLDEAIEKLELALRTKPDFPEALYNLANAYVGKGRQDDAVDSLRQALRIKPDYARAHFALGNVLRSQGRLDEAVESYHRTLQLQPGAFAAYQNLGIALMDQGKLDEAAESLNQAIRIGPASASVHNHLGVLLRRMERPQEAIDSYRRALQINPNHVNAHNNMGNLLKDLGRLDEAIEHFRLALQTEPAIDSIRAQKLHQQAHICDWSAFVEFEALGHKLGIEGEAVYPFAMLAFEDNPERQARRSQNFAPRPPGRQATPLTPLRGRPQGKIRLGYFSADFHDHATLYLMSGLLREHDRRRFEIFAYSYGATRVGEMREKLIGDVDCFSDVKDLSNQEIAELARSHGIDIAFDLKGFTQHTRSALFARRLAPIQVNYLGYPGTMGAEYFDFIVADRVVIPEAERGTYTEEVIDLPNSYQPNDNRRKIAETHTSRGDFGLPESGFVFCCFNQAYKITPREFDIWMRLLKKVNGSVLWLLSSNRWAEANLRSEAEMRGIDPVRLVFAEQLPHASHLARHKHADLFIDTFNVNAHTTASDALWAGLPLVTKAGRQFAARVAASLLSAVGLPELITETEEDYEALILDLANRPERLAAIKSKLAENRLTQPLFDTVRYARDFERAIEAAWTAHASAQ